MRMVWAAVLCTWATQAHVVGVLRDDEPPHAPPREAPEAASLADVHCDNGRTAVGSAGLEREAAVESGGALSLMRASGEGPDRGTGAGTVRLEAVEDRRTTDSVQAGTTSFASLERVLEYGTKVGAKIRMSAGVVVFLGCVSAIVLVIFFLNYYYSLTIVDLDSDGLEKLGRPSDTASYRRSSLHIFVGDLSCVMEDSAELLVGNSDSMLTPGPADAPKMSTRSASMGLFTVMVGAGVLALPKAVATVGWALAAPLIVAAALINAMVCHTLVDAIERASKKGTVNQFKDVASIAFGPAGARLADAAFVAFLASCCAVYIVLIADNLNFIFPWAKRPWILVTGALVSCAGLVNDVSVLSKLAVVGVISSLFYVPCIVSGAMNAAASYDDAERDLPKWPTGWSGVLRVFCVLLFGFCCCDTLTSFRASMERPQDLPKAINQSHVAVTIVYLVAGLGGFYGWGREVEGNILESMCTPPGCVGTGEPPRTADGSGQKIIWGYLLACAVIANLVVSLPFSAFVLFKSIEAKYIKLQDSKVANTIMRLLTVAFMTFVGIVVPFFMEMINIMSSLLIVAIVIILPTSFALKFDYDDGKRVSLVHIATLLIGVVAMVVGFIDSMSELREAVEKNPDALNPFHNFWGSPGTVS